MSIVIRDLVDVVDVLSSDVVDVYELLLDLPEDEPELAVVINKFFPDKFALTSLNCIFDPLDSLSSFLEQEKMARLRRGIRSMRTILLIFFSKLKSKLLLFC